MRFQLLFILSFLFVSLSEGIPLREVYSKKGHEEYTRVVQHSLNEIHALIEHSGTFQMSHDQREVVKELIKVRKLFGRNKDVLAMTSDGSVAVTKILLRRIIDYASRILRYTKMEFSDVEIKEFTMNVWMPQFEQATETWLEFVKKTLPFIRTLNY